MLFWQSLFGWLFLTLALGNLGSATSLRYRQKRRLEQIDDLHEKMGLELSRISKYVPAAEGTPLWAPGDLAAALKGERSVVQHHTFEFRHSAERDDLCLLGHDIRIRRTAIGKPFRLIHNGAEVGQFDDQNTAQMECCMLAMQELMTQEDLSKAPPIDIPKAGGDEPG